MVEILVERLVRRLVRRLAKVAAVTPSRLLLALMTGMLAVAELAGVSVGAGRAKAEEPGLVGHWPLQGDCRDHSGHGLHGVNYGVDLATGLFNGRNAYIEIPASDSLRLGAGDFTIVASVFTDEIVDDTLGDVVSLYDARRRRGVTLNLKASSGGYQSSGDDRHVYFGIDNDRLGEWRDCGRPSRTSNYVANSLTVFDGNLYAATIDAQDPARCSGSIASRVLAASCMLAATVAYRHLANGNGRAVPTRSTSMRAKRSGASLAVFHRNRPAVYMRTRWLFMTAVYMRAIPTSSPSMEKLGSSLVCQLAIRRSIRSRTYKSTRWRSIAAGCWPVCGPKRGSSSMWTKRGAAKPGVIAASLATAPKSIP